jgi:hypothetical protein
MGMAKLTVEVLRPEVTARLRFSWPEHFRVPNSSGCYALVTLQSEVLYVGLATKSVRDRFMVHLDTSVKRVAGPHGVAYWFYFLLLPPEIVGKVERGWMNQSILATGALPIFNKVESPL